jgi:uncharacterized protein (DUF4415 family)
MCYAWYVLQSPYTTLNNYYEKGVLRKNAKKIISLRIIFDVIEIEWDGMDRKNYQAQGDQWDTHANAVMNLFPLHAVIFVSG